MFIKILACENFKKKYVVVGEDHGSFSVIDGEGNFEQFNRTKLEVDSLNEFSVDDFYLHENCPKIKNAVLKHRVNIEKSNIEDFLGLDFKPVGNQGTSFLSTTKDTSLHFYYAQYNAASESCSVKISQSELSTLSDGLREVVVLVLEEFGNLYLDGQKMREYLSTIKPENKKGRKFWTLNINYQELISVSGHPNFQFYSDNIQYVQNFSQAEFTNNIVDLDVIRQIRNIQTTQERRAKGVTLRKSA